MALSVLDEEFERIARETREGSANKAREAMGEKFSQGRQATGPSQYKKIADAGSSAAREGNLPRAVGQVASKIGGYIKATGVLGALIGGMTNSKGLNEGEDAEIAEMKAKTAASKVSNEVTAVQSTVNPADLPELAFLDQSARMTGSIAKMETNETAVKTGTVGEAQTSYSYVLQPGSKVLRTWGNTKVVTDPKTGNLNVTVHGDPYEIPASQRPATDDTNVIKAKVEGVKPGWDLKTEYENLKKLSLDDRLDKANLLLVNIEMEAGKEQENIKGLAAQQAGVNNARASLDSYTMLANKLRPGQSVTEVETARKVLNDAMIIADKFEKDLAASSPKLRELKGFHDAITRDMGLTSQRVGRDERKKDKRDFEMEKVNAVITPDKAVAGRYALNINDPANAEEEDKAKQTVFLSAQKDKALQNVLEADRNNIFTYLTSTDPKTRNYAFRVARGFERNYRGIPKDAPDPDNINYLKTIVENPDKWIAEYRHLIPPSTLKRQREAGSLDTGPKEKAARAESNRMESVNAIIDAQFKQGYDRMNAWTYTNPSIKKVIDVTANTSKEKYVTMEDGINAIVQTEIKDPTGKIMTFQEKKLSLLASLDVTTENDKKSFITPDPVAYKGDLSEKIKNMMDRAFIRKLNPFGVPNIFGSAPQ